MSTRNRVERLQEINKNLHREVGVSRACGRTREEGGQLDCWSLGCLGVHLLPARPAANPTKRVPWCDLTTVAISRDCRRAEAPKRWSGVPVEQRTSGLDPSNLRLA